MVDRYDEHGFKLPLNWPSGAPISRVVQIYRSILAHNSDPEFRQDHYRFGDDDGSTEANYTLIGTEDTILVLVQDGLGNITKILRISVDETLNNADQNQTVTFKWQFRIDTGGGFGSWGDILTSGGSEPVLIVNASSFADDADTTLRNTATFSINADAGTTTEDGTHSSTLWDNQRTNEYVAAIQFVDANLGGGDALQFRILESDGTVLDVYDVIPEVTWTVPDITESVSEGVDLSDTATSTVVAVNSVTDGLDLSDTPVEAVPGFPTDISGIELGLGQNRHGPFNYVGTEIEGNTNHNNTIQNVLNFGSNGTGADRDGEKWSDNFSPGSNVTAVSARMSIFMSTGLETDSVKISIYDDDSGDPGSEIASGTFPAAQIPSHGSGFTTLSTHHVARQYFFDTPVALTGSTPYHIVVERTGSLEASPNWHIGLRSQAGGNAKRLRSGVWTVNTGDDDMWFQILDGTEKTYIVGRDATNKSELAVYMSDDGGVTFNEQDGGNNPDQEPTQDLELISATDEDSDKNRLGYLACFVGSQGGSGATANYDYHHHVYDFGSDTWRGIGASSEDVAVNTVSDDGVALEVRGDIAVCQNGRTVVLFTGDREDVSGTFYARTYVTHAIDQASWSTPVLIHASGLIQHSGSARIVPADFNRLIFLVSQLNTDFACAMTCYRGTDNTLQTFPSFGETSVGRTDLKRSIWGSGVTYESGGDRVLRAPYTDADGPGFQLNLGTIDIVSDTLGTFVKDTDVGAPEDLEENANFNQIAAMVAHGTDLYLVWSASADADLFLTKNPDDTSWETISQPFNITTADIQQLSANVYVRDGITRLAIVVLDGSTVKYDEFDLADPDITESVSDAVDLADTPIDTITAVNAETDAVDLSDTATVVPVKHVSGSDGLDLSDTATAAIKKAEAVSEGLDLSDTPINKVVFRESASDGLDLSDTPIDKPILRETVSEGLDLADTATDARTVRLGRHATLFKGPAGIGRLRLGTTTPTTDLKHRVYVELTNSVGMDLALSNQGDDSDNQYSFRFYRDANNNLVFKWSPDGTPGAEITATSTIVTPNDVEGYGFDIDVDNGASGYDVLFWTFDGSTWTQLGSTIVGGSTTSLHQSTDFFFLGNSPYWSEEARGFYFGLEVFYSLGGGTDHSAFFDPTYSTDVPTFRNWVFPDGTVGAIEGSKGVSWDESFIIDEVELSDTATSNVPGGPIQEAVSDGLDLSDTATTKLDAKETSSDGLDLSDTATAKPIKAVSASDGLDLADTPIDVATMVELVSDVVDLADTATASVVGSGVIQESVSDGMDLVDTPKLDPFVIVQSGNIAASGEDTTVQLNTPAGKSTDDFDPGRIQDDENPTDNVDIGNDNYTEIEFTLGLTPDADIAVYRFRLVCDDGTPLDTYTLFPELQPAGAEVVDGVDLSDVAIGRLGGSGTASDGVELADTPAQAKFDRWRHGIMLVDTSLDADEPPSHPTTSLSLRIHGVFDDPTGPAGVRNLTWKTGAWEFNLQTNGAGDIQYRFQWTDSAVATQSVLSSNPPNDIRGKKWHRVDLTFDVGGNPTVAFFTSDDDNDNPSWGGAIDQQAPPIGPTDLQDTASDVEVNTYDDFMPLFKALEVYYDGALVANYAPKKSTRSTNIPTFSTWTDEFGLDFAPTGTKDVNWSERYVHDIAELADTAVSEVVLKESVSDGLTFSDTAVAQALGTTAVAASDGLDLSDTVINSITVTAPNTAALDRVVLSDTAVATVIRTGITTKYMHYAKMRNN